MGTRCITSECDNTVKPDSALEVNTVFMIPRVEVSAKVKSARVIPMLFTVFDHCILYLIPRARAWKMKPSAPSPGNNLLQKM